MQIEQFTKSDLIKLRTEMDAALKVVGDKYGISLRCGNGTFANAEFTMKVLGKVTGEAAIKAKNEKLSAACSIYRLDESKTSFDGFKLVDYNRRKYSKPFVVSKDGKQFVMTLDQAQARFAL